MTGNKFIIYDLISEWISWKEILKINALKGLKIVKKNIKVMNTIWNALQKQTLSKTRAIYLMLKRAEIYLNDSVKNNKFMRKKPLIRKCIHKQIRLGINWNWAQLEV